MLAFVAPLYSAEPLHSAEPLRFTEPLWPAEILHSPAPLRSAERGKRIIEFYPRIGTLMERPNETPVMWKTMSYGFTAGLGFQTAGEEYWHEYFGYPRYGLRLNYNHYDNKIYGDNIALYPYLQAPLVRSGAFSLDYSIGFGVAYHTDKFDPVKNPENVYIGSSFTAVIDLEVVADFQVSDHFGLFTGIGFSHYSNGAMSYPNKGLNAFTAMAGIRYQPRRIEWRAWTGGIPVIERKNEIYTFFAPSFIVRNSDEGKWDGNKTFFCSTLELGYKRQFHPCFKWGAGVDMVYTGNEKYDVASGRRTNWNNLSLLAFGSLEIFFGRVSLNVAAGAYPFYSAKGRGNICERVGVFYHFGRNDEQFAGLSIKATKGSADYIEWTYGVRLFRF